MNWTLLRRWCSLNDIFFGGFAAQNLAQRNYLFIRSMERFRFNQHWRIENFVLWTKKKKTYHFSTGSWCTWKYRKLTRLRDNCGHSLIKLEVRPSWMFMCLTFRETETFVFIFLASAIEHIHRDWYQQDYLQSRDSVNRTKITEKWKNRLIRKTFQAIRCLNSLSLSVHIAMYCFFFYSDVTMSA